MIEAQIIYQCGGCGRYCDGAGSPLSPQPRMGQGIGVPEVCTCGECVAEPENAAAAAWRVQLNPPRCLRPAAVATRKPQISNRKSERQAGIERSLPPERDVAAGQLGPDAAALNGLSHRQQESEFARSSEAARRDLEVFNLMEASFHGAAPGDWIVSEVFRTVVGIRAVNSCARRIREWPQMVAAEWDVDSKVLEVADDIQIWAYRLCRRVDSERLQREALRRGRADRQAAGDADEN